MVRYLTLLIPAILELTSCSNNVDSESKPQIILAADREAPIGWVKFHAYSDNTFEYSLDARDKYHGNYRIKGDTLFLDCANPNIGMDTVIIEGESLKFLGKQSPRYAGISINKIH